MLTVQQRIESMFEAIRADAPDTTDQQQLKRFVQLVHGGMKVLDGVKEAQLGMYLEYAQHVVDKAPAEVAADLVQSARKGIAYFKGQPFSQEALKFLPRLQELLEKLVGLR